MFLGILGDLHEEDAGFDFEGHVLLVERKDAVHVGEVEEDAAVDGDGAADEAGAGAAHRDGYALGVGVFHDARDLVRRKRLDEGVGAVARTGEFVMPVVLADGVRGNDAVLAADGDEEVEVGLAKCLVCP